MWREKRENICIVLQKIKEKWRAWKNAQVKSTAQEERQIVLLPLTLML